ncbi:14081_t:CDS:2, partial [Acaulospora morrowiae]
DLKKINDYSAKLGVLIKEGLFFASNILSYFSENHNEFVKGWKNDLDSRGKINNLADPHLNYIDESIKNCKIFAIRFSEFYKFLKKAIAKLEESHQKIEESFQKIEKTNKPIYEQILEKKMIDERNQKSGILFTYKKKASDGNASLKKLNEQGYKNLIMDRLIVELECIKNRLKILKLEEVSDFWKQISDEFQINKELMKENVNHGELYVKENLKLGYLEL